MADFIAVIRRAVDGLSDNTPEMRIRVYDRARTAVQRQLDNMKPRPADDVIARQLEKLDDAIAAIESEFSGAPVTEPPAQEAEPIARRVAEPEPEPEPEAGIPESAAPQPAPPEVAPEPEPRYVKPEPPVMPEPPAFLRRDPEPVVTQKPKPEPVLAPEPEPRPAPAFEPEPEPSSSRFPEDEATSPSTLTDDDTMPPEQVEPEKATLPEDRLSEPFGLREPVRASERTWEKLEEPTPAPAPPFEQDRHSHDFAPSPVARRDDAATEAWTPVVTDNPFHEPAEIFAPKPDPEPVTRRDDPFALEKPKPAAEQKSWWDQVEATPPSSPASSARDASWDSFEAFVGERSSTNSGAEAVKPTPPRGRDGMSIGPQEPPRETKRASAPEPDREGRGKLIAGIVAAVIVLAGVGYTGWRFSDSILGLVNGSSSTGSQTASKSTPAGSQQPAATTTAPATNNASSSTAAPAAAGPQKFTQRLLADGSEVDSGTSGEQVASAGQAEGKSVANQNEKPPAQPTNTQAPAQPSATPAAAGQSDAASGQQSSAVKIFLYEERLGQASPTALEGTVTWSVKTDDQDGHKEKMIQGDISVPGRKMSAIFTLRKNNDPTLPASHIIELTFSLPKDFEGRGIENVLRISMKDKEQEQGDPLVAVPAKITDYFHMIALNAFADAVKTNLNLLKTRDWIDIPVTYSNGRRALLTLQKGPDGEKVFDEVISSWQASGASNIPTPSPPPAQ